MKAEERFGKTIGERKMPLSGRCGWSCSICSAQGVDAAGQCPGWHLLGTVVSPCTAPQGSSRDSPTPSITSPALSQLPTFHSPGLWGLLTVPCTRPCRGSHSFCLYNPGIAASVSKPLRWLLPPTCVFSMEHWWMPCLCFLPSPQTSQTAGAVSCRDPASQTGHGIPLSFNCYLRNPAFPIPAFLWGQAMQDSAHARLIQDPTTLYSAAAVQPDAKQFARLPGRNRNRVIPEQSCAAPTSRTSIHPFPTRPWKPQVPMKSCSTRGVQFIVHHLTLWRTGEIWPCVLIFPALYKALSFTI